jgi:hypothetical protein
MAPSTSSDLHPWREPRPWVGRIDGGCGFVCGYAGRQKTDWPRSSIDGRIKLSRACFNAKSNRDKLSSDHETVFESRVTTTCQVYAGNRTVERKVASIQTSHFLLKKVTRSRSVKKLGRCQIKSGSSIGRTTAALN